VELLVDEYGEDGYDAVTLESAFGDEEAPPAPSGEPSQFGTLGRALWRERSLAWILRSNPDVRAEDAEKIVAELSAAARPLCAD